MASSTDNIAVDDPHHFDFDLDCGIREQVVEKLEASPMLSLARGVGPALSGIYALYFKGVGRPGTDRISRWNDLFPKKL